MSSVHRESDDRLLGEMSALARLVDDAWHIARQSPDDDGYEKAVDDWSTLRVEVLSALGQSRLMQNLQDPFRAEPVAVGSAGALCPATAGSPLPGLFMRTCIRAVSRCPVWNC